MYCSAFECKQVRSENWKCCRVIMMMGVCLREYGSEQPCAHQWAGPRSLFVATHGLVWCVVSLVSFPLSPWACFAVVLFWFELFCSACVSLWQATPRVILNLIVSNSLHSCVLHFHFFFAPVLLWAKPVYNGPQPTNNPPPPPPPVLC